MDRLAILQQVNEFITKLESDAEVTAEEAYTLLVNVRRFLQPPSGFISEKELWSGNREHTT